MRCFNFRWPPGCPDQVGRAPVPSGTKAWVRQFSCLFLEPSLGWLLVQAAPVVQSIVLHRLLHGFLITLCSVPGMKMRYTMM